MPNSKIKVDQLDLANIFASNSLSAAYATTPTVHGATGFQGATGVSTTGFQGATGISTTGFQGATGYIGATGASTTGFQGATGVGILGWQGATGVVIAHFDYIGGGNHTWQCPSNVSQIGFIAVAGGGGGGGGCHANAQGNSDGGGGGGGSGGGLMGYLNVVPNRNYLVYVGQGGESTDVSDTAIDGGAGGNTYMYDPVANAYLCFTYGGGGGVSYSRAANNYTGGACGLGQQQQSSTMYGSANLGSNGGCLFGSNGGNGGYPGNYGVKGGSASLNLYTVNFSVYPYTFSEFGDIQYYEPGANSTTGASGRGGKGYGAGGGGIGGYWSAGYGGVGGGGGGAAGHFGDIALAEDGNKNYDGTIHSGKGAHGVFAIIYKL